MTIKFNVKRKNINSLKIKCLKTIYSFLQTLSVNRITVCISIRVLSFLLKQGTRTRQSRWRTVTVFRVWAVFNETRSVMVSGMGPVAKCTRKRQNRGKCLGYRRGRGPPTILHVYTADGNGFSLAETSVVRRRRVNRTTT